MLLLATCRAETQYRERIGYVFSATQVTRTKRNTNFFYDVAYIIRCLMCMIVFKLKTLRHGGWEDLF